MAKKLYAVGEHEFEGTTLKEAKEKAQLAIQIAFSGSYEPKILFWRNHTLVISRSQDGWGYRIIWPQDRKEGELIGAWMNQSNMTRVDAEIAGTYHLAQAAWTYEDGVGAPTFLNVVSKRQELESWQRWQLRYRYFRLKGFPDQDCHRLASDYTQHTPHDSAHPAPPVKDTPLVFEECKTCERPQNECDCG